MREDAAPAATISLRSWEKAQQYAAASQMNVVSNAPLTSSHTFSVWSHRQITSNEDAAVLDVK